MDYVFIDSNIWLSLYHFTNDDLKQFEKLKTIVGSEIKLVIPSQLCDELRRNREAKLNDMLKEFKIQKLKIPAFAEGYSEEYDNLITSYKETESKFNLLKEKINSDIKSELTPADILINDFFHSADIVACDSSIVSVAYDRYNRGNPPGKDRKYGDAINWECLLRTVPDDCDLYLVSADKDYRSLLSEEEINPFLLKEWKKKKNSDIYFFTSLVHFLKGKFNEIQLRDEMEKLDLILGLLSSQNYATTHAIVRGLYKFSDWSAEQRESLCEAVVNNNQVGNILGDLDVLQFYSDLLCKVDYDSLDDCYTKTVMEYIFTITEDNSDEQEAYEDERMDFLENHSCFHE